MTLGVVRDVDVGKVIIAKAPVLIATSSQTQNHQADQ
jgi:hypothetical protein